MTNYRDAETGRWTTAKDAAERPAETVAETVPTRHETPDVAELRRLAEACPMPDNDPDTLSEWYEVKELTERNYPIPPIDAAFIAAASPDVILGLLDRLAHMTEARDNARAEVERLGAQIEAVRALHARESFWQYHRDQEHSYLTQQEAADESGCDCPYAPETSADLDHTPECLATISHFDVCSECARIEYADAERQAHGEFSGYAEALWPCPTIRALDGGES